MSMIKIRQKLLTVFVTASFMAVIAGPSRADTFDAGSLIIPMDIDYQDDGMFEAYGLLYQLLLGEIPVSWVIREDKLHGEEDFTASAVDVDTLAVITEHGYRGGPFVIDAANADDALAIIQSWHDGGHTTAVHQSTGAFAGHVAYVLVTAPTIAVFADGTEDVAFQYLNAAGIPDSFGKSWPEKKDKNGNYPDYVDILNLDQVAGDNHTTDHRDGALFDENDNPAYCQIMTMHWKIWDSSVGNPSASDEEIRNDGAVAEIAEFLKHPTHLMAECQAVNAIENSYYGKFLTPNGFEIDDQPGDVQFFNAGFAFGQLDGDFETVGGSEPSFSLPPGDAYYDRNVVMVTEAGSPPGTKDVWMSGFVGDSCSIGGEEIICTNTVGKVSYLGGHRYSVDLPISSHPDSQGTRLFLNSLFEAPCTSAESQPVVTVTKDAPEATVDPTVTYVVEVHNQGPIAVNDVILADALPAGASFVSASGGGVYADGVVTWDLISYDVREGSGPLSLTVNFGDYGTYENSAKVQYKVGQKITEITSATTSTVYGECIPGDVQCVGLTPQTCDATGFWVVDEDCEFACADGTGCYGECHPETIECVDGESERVCLEDYTWGPAQTCEFYCDDNGAETCQGECHPDTHECINAVDERVCGPDYLWGSATACEYYCDDGGSEQCEGECNPADQECINNTDLRVCDDNYTWGLASSCQYVCDENSDTCAGSCVPSNTQCVGLVYQTCDELGDWQPTQTCVYACDESTGCYGECQPGATDCHDETSERLCQADYTFGDPVLCDFYCDVDGTQNCQGECSPGAIECVDAARARECLEDYTWSAAVGCTYFCDVGGTNQCAGECHPGEQECVNETDLRVCGDDYSWGEPTACSFACDASTDTCTGSCTPESTQCVGLKYQICDSLGDWQLTAECDYACDDDTGCYGECQPGAVECVDETNERTCRSDYTWGDPVACSNFCDDGGSEQCAGDCTPGVTECINASYERVCKDDFTWSMSLCNFYCDEGGGERCAGECHPGDQQCATSTELRICNDTYEWESSTCPFVCDASSATCAGTCTPGETQCVGRVFQTCDSNGDWQPTTSCSYACDSEEGCFGDCIKGAVDCLDGQHERTCMEDSTWSEPVECPFYCDETGVNQCAGECHPRAQECLNTAEIRICNDTYTWNASQDCPFACDTNTDTCVGTCIPGSTQCDGLDYMLCNVQGDWQKIRTCDYACSEGSGCYGECVAGDTRCDVLTLRLCNEENAWVDAQECEIGCTDGACDETDTIDTLTDTQDGTSTEDQGTSGTDEGTGGSDDSTDSAHSTDDGTDENADSGTSEGSDENSDAATDNDTGDTFGTDMEDTSPNDDVSTADTSEEPGYGTGGPDDTSTDDSTDENYYTAGPSDSSCGCQSVGAPLPVSFSVLQAFLFLF